MKSRYVFVLALFLFCSCANANNADVMAKATQEAEVAANRAEASANAAEIAADRAEQAAKKYDQEAGDADESVRRTEDVNTRLCGVCDSCSRGSGPAVARYQEYRAIQEAACSAPSPSADERHNKIPFLAAPGY